MREIVMHKGSDLNGTVDCHCIDGPAASPHAPVGYEIHYGDGPRLQIGLFFQNGPLQDVGANGISDEVLIAIIIDRLQAFQQGDFSCRENALAITKLDEAMHWLNHRTNDRVRRGVEGKSER